ncbi:MAG: hypothetical protein ACE5DX_01440 [Candidatus Dojkabacteria bacterium]
MKNIFHWKKRPFVYAIIITVGFAFLISILENLSDGFFFMGAIALYFVLLFELFITISYAKRLLDQFELPQVNSKHVQVQLVHHLVLPSLAYYSLIAYLFFNHQLSLKLLTLALVFVIFAILFTNIRALYEDKYKLEQSTHSIYDAIMILTAFLGTDALLNSLSFIGSPTILILLSVTALLALLGVLVIVRYQLLKPIFVLELVITIILFNIVLYILLSIGLAVFITSFLSTLFFYYILAFLSHLHEGTASKKILIEYVIVFAIMIVVLYGLI